VLAILSPQKAPKTLCFLKKKKGKNRCPSAFSRFFVFDFYFAPMLFLLVPPPPEFVLFFLLHPGPMGTFPVLRCILSGPFAS